MGGGDKEISETADQVEQAKINAALYNYYQKTYKPQIDKYIGKVTDTSITEAEGRQVAGQIRGEAMKWIGPGAASDNPIVNARTLSKLGQIETTAQVKGQGAVRSRNIGQLQNVIDIGRGQETEAQKGLTELAGQSVSEAIGDAENEWNKSAATANTVASLAGVLSAGAYRKLSSSGPTNKALSWATGD